LRGYHTRGLLILQRHDPKLLNFFKILLYLLVSMLILKYLV